MGNCPICNGVGMVRMLDLENPWEACPRCCPEEKKDAGRGFFKHLWLWFLARFRLSESAVCEMSKGRGLHDDFHNYPDSTNGGLPWLFYEHECKRCGKKFTI